MLVDLHIRRAISYRSVLEYLILSVSCLRTAWGHTLMVLIDTDDVIIVLCTKCGKWSQKRLRGDGLGSACNLGRGKNGTGLSTGDRTTLARVAAKKHQHCTVNSSLIVSFPLQHLAEGKRQLPELLGSGASQCPKPPAPWTRLCSGEPAAATGWRPAGPPPNRVRGSRSRKT